MSLSRRMVRDTLALLVPVCCAGCGSAGRGVCGQCRAGLRAACRPRVEEIAGVACASGADYGGPVPRLIHAYKERGRADVAAALAPVLRASIAALELEPAPGQVRGSPGSGTAQVPGIVVVPVPSRRAARAARGYDHVALLIERALPGAQAVDGLRIRRRVADQAGLGVGARERNLRGALVARPALSGGRVLLVDDVRTSGATLREAIRAVREAGADPVGAAVVTAVARHPGAAVAAGKLGRDGI